MGIFNAILVVQSFFKILFFLRVFENFGKLVKLVAQCINDVNSFMFFFGGWIFVFSILFQILGLELFDEDYIGFNSKITYLVYTYRNAIGDSNPPKTIYWLSQTEDHPFLPIPPHPPLEGRIKGANTGA